MNDRLLKKIVLGFGVLIGFVILLAIANGFSHTGKTAITLEIAPSIATSTIDGKQVHGGIVYISKGEHTLTVDLADFTSKSQTFTVSSQAQSINLALQPANATGRKLLTDNPAYQLQREAIGGEQKAALQAQAETPLISKLPYTDITGPFQIDYGQSPTRKGGTVIIINNSAPIGRVHALDWIRQQGYDPANLEIQFADFANPLTVGLQPVAAASTIGNDSE
jgi:hypothetical protein